MKIWAIADLHLSISCPEKNMGLINPAWKNYEEKIQSNWHYLVRSEDLVLVAGDISWAKTFDQSLQDLEWLDKLPGTKIIIKGNHDYWWPSITKLRKYLPPSIIALKNDAIYLKQIAIGGARLWDTNEYHFNDLVDWQKNSKESLQEKKSKDENETIFHRELQRLENSLKQMNPKAKLKIAMTHYPPIGIGLASSKASEILDKYQIDICIFGHLHNLKQKPLIFGKKNQTQYVLTSCDMIDFTPLLIS